MVEAVQKEVGKGSYAYIINIFENDKYGCDPK